MATYVAEPDTYAGWSTGRYFGLFGLAAGAIAFGSWAVLHGHMRGMAPIAPADQMFLWGMQWIGGAVFLLMAVCVFGSLGMSAKSRGIVTVDDVGVQRQIGRRRWILRWEELEGYVVMGSGGITLIPIGKGPRIEIPMFLDDYRACIAELKARGLRSLPSDRLQASMRQRRRTWRDWLYFFLGLSLFMNAFEAGPHALRICSLCAWIAFSGIMMKRDEALKRLPWTSQVVAASTFVAVLGWLLYHMAHTW